MSVDTRTASYRRFRDLYDGYSTLLGGNPSLPQQNLIRRLATHDVALERCEGDMASGVPIDMTLYATLSNGHRRILECLGLAEAGVKPEPWKPDERFDMSQIRFVGVEKDDPAPAAPEPAEVADAIA